MLRLVIIVALTDSRCHALYSKPSIIRYGRRRQGCATERRPGAIWLGLQVGGKIARACGFGVPPSMQRACKSEIPTRVKSLLVSLSECAWRSAPQGLASF